MWLTVSNFQLEMFWQGSDFFRIGFHSSQRVSLRCFRWEFKGCLWRAVTSKGFNYQGKESIIHSHGIATVLATHRENRVERAPGHGYLPCDSSPVQASLKSCVHIILLCFTWSISLSNLRRQFLVLSTVGLHVRTVAEGSRREHATSAGDSWRKPCHAPSFHVKTQMQKNPKQTKKPHTFF